MAAVKLFSAKYGVNIDSAGSWVTTNTRIVNNAPPATAAAPAAPKPAPQAAPPAPKPEPPAAPVAPSATPAGGGTVIAPIPGLILDVKVKVGDQVLAGETVAVMEAMKMENNVVSDVSGTVKEVMVQKGAEVSTGDVLMIIG